MTMILNANTEYFYRLSTLRKNAKRLSFNRLYLIGDLGINDRQRFRIHNRNTSTVDSRDNIMTTGSSASAIKKIEPSVLFFPSVHV